MDGTRCYRAMSDWALHRRELRWRGVCVAVSTLLANLSSAGAAPDIELGRYLARECATCHRSATATSTIPNIYGIAETTFIRVIKAYREKRIDNAVMQNVAARLKDDEIEALAAYFSRTTRP